MCIYVVYGHTILMRYFFVVNVYGYVFSHMFEAGLMASEAVSCGNM